jgi:trigger factor
MNITLDQKTTTDGTIRISLAETDYLPKVEEKVREYSRKMNIKGFRAGKVPAGVVRKMYGKSILVDEVNHILSHSVSDYIKERKLTVLGDPIPNQELAQKIDWDNQKDFEFEFQIGLVENFSVEVSTKVKLPSYKIAVDDKVVNDAVEDMKRRFGNIINPEVSGADDNLFGEITPIPRDALSGQAAGDGTSKSAYIQIDKAAAGEKNRLIGLKKDDTLVIDAEKITDDASVRAQIFNVTEEEAKALKGSYTLKVTNISHNTPAEVNQELFDKVFGKDAVSSEAEFKTKIRETIGENYQRESGHLLDHEIEHYLVDHTKVNMPDHFLKAWLKATGDGKITDEVIGKEFEAYKKGLKWDLIKNKVAEEFKANVESGEVRERAKQLLAQQFGGPAIIEQLGERFDKLAENYLAGQDGKGENFMRLYNQLRHEKILKAIRERITITEKAVSLDEFKKAADAHAHE